MPIDRSDARSRRQKALQWGHVAEWLAMFAMILKGYRPLAVRYQGWGGEIDLIMRRGKTILFIEVKAPGFSTFGHSCGQNSQIKSGHPALADAS